ncbi:angiogenic factor with G patch and FHA domains 1-like [Pecten maximus]|uniref:angiogenic factor with G patch and FHA domains 1-like n=1 Tax=Pecten maximus TaxID=6579 RepID=UPI00145803D1|nr:angiogenic factor with G patch and FHA domains 1-like [Pecten maximus]
MEKENINNPDTEKGLLHADLLQHCQHELKTLQEKLMKTEQQLEKSNAYNEELRDELDKLNSELHILKSATKEKTDAETQTDYYQDDFNERDGLSRDQAIVIDESINEGHEDETGEDAKISDSAKTLVSEKTDASAIAETGATVENDNKPEDDNKMESDDKVEKEGKQEEEKASSTSLADELRATAEAAVQQTGYVYDENSGLYYDYNSGYYYNAEKALYYDPNTGTYFYYNSESGKYEFHSQVDVSQYSTSHDSQQINSYDQYQHGDHYSRGGNYDQSRRDYHTSHRHNDSGYDQYHRALPRKDRETSRSSKSHVEYDHHTPHRREKEGSSSRKDSDKKKRSKRLQSEEMEYHKRKKKKKEKKKKKRKSSKEKKRDRSPGKKSDEKCSDGKKRKGKESREKSEEGEVRSEDDDSKEGEVNKENDNDEESYDLAGNSESYMDELYESFDENSNNEVTSEEGSTIDNLYDDLGEENVQCVSGDDFLSKCSEDYLIPEDQKQSKKDDSNMELSPTNTDNVNTTYSKQTEYSEHKKKQNSNDSSHNTTGKFRKKRSTSYSDVETAHKKSHHNEEENTLHRNESTSNKHRIKKSRSNNSHKYEHSRSSNSKKSKDQHDDRYWNKHGETLCEKQVGDCSEISGKTHLYKSGKQGRKSSMSRHMNTRKTASKSRRKLAASASDSDSSNSLCTGESELESGEITSSSEEEPVAMQCDEDVQAGYGEGHSHDVIMAEEEIVSKWPPCIRMIVTDSDIIDPGTLFIVTCTGATVGREKEMGHTVLIPDINISKAHAEIHFDEDKYHYYLTDLASQNGTFLNEERVSEVNFPRLRVSPKFWAMMIILQFGCTRLLLHIHDGTDTCDECEPGQVQAQLQAQNQQQKEIVILSKEEKFRQQKQQLKKIKKKYGLKNSAYEDNMAAINNPGYNDKADERRKTVGSDNPYQPDEAPASVHRPISEGNKGHKMLKKLGWTEGESLGKDNEGIRQPISVKFRANKSAGLGSGSVGVGSVEEVGDLHRRQKWLEVQRRYNKMEEDKTTGSGHNKMTLTTPKWVQGETQES